MYLCAVCTLPIDLNEWNENYKITKITEEQAETVTFIAKYT